MNPVGMLLAAMAGAAFGISVMCLLISWKKADENMDRLMERKAENAGLNEIPDMEEFKKATEPAVKWLKENCNPHQQIIVEMDGVKLVSGDMAYPCEIPD